MKNKLSINGKIAMIGVLCCISFASDAATEFGRTGIGAIGGCIENNEITPAVVTVNGQDYTANINFYDYRSVADAVKKIKADALAKNVKEDGLLENILNQLTVLAKKLAIHGRTFVKVDMDDIGYPTLDGVCDRPDQEERDPNRRSEMQTDNPALTQEVQHLIPLVPPPPSESPK